MTPEVESPWHTVPLLVFRNSGWDLDESGIQSQGHTGLPTMPSTKFEFCRSERLEGPLVKCNAHGDCTTKERLQEYNTSSWRRQMIWSRRELSPRGPSDRLRAQLNSLARCEQQQSPGTFLIPHVERASRCVWQGASKIAQLHHYSPIPLLLL